MANLEIIKLLNERYGKKSILTEEVNLFEAFDLNKSLDIEKGFNNELASLNQEYTKYFDFGLPANVALLFIDVCNFSTRYSTLNGEGISDYFDEYYNKIIPIIYKYGGEIDKIIGDGIICVFGQPFLNLNYAKCIQAASNCAKEIIIETMGRNFSSKIAFHSGSIHYYKNKSGLYKEFTMVGKPLTELFRLESISLNEQINYFNDSDIFRFYNPDKLKFYHMDNIPKNKWFHMNQKIPKLNGVEYTSAYSLKYIK